MTRGNVDDQPPNLAVGHRLEMIGDRVEVEPGHKPRHRFDDRPRRAQVGAEAATAALRVHLHDRRQAQVSRSH